MKAMLYIAEHSNSLFRFSWCLLKVPEESLERIEYRCDIWCINGSPFEDQLFKRFKITPMFNSGCLSDNIPQNIDKVLISHVLGYDIDDDQEHAIEIEDPDKFVVDLKDAIVLYENTSVL